MYGKSDRCEKPCERSPPPDSVSPFLPARLFCGCFSRFPDLLARIKPRLEAQWGPITRQSPILDFPETRLYTPAMGHDLKRIFYVFEGLWPQDCLAEVKHKTGAIEEEIAKEGDWPVRRPLNLDPGLLTMEHIVLASTKDRGHRLPRADGVYEEITLLYFDGAFQPLLWTYSDWKSQAYHAFFERVREEFRKETRDLRRRFQERQLKQRF